MSHFVLSHRSTFLSPDLAFHIYVVFHLNLLLGKLLGERREVGVVLGSIVPAAAGIQLRHGAGPVVFPLNLLLLLGQGFEVKLISGKKDPSLKLHFREVALLIDSGPFWCEIPRTFLGLRPLVTIQNSRSSLICWRRSRIRVWYPARGTASVTY